MSEPKNLLWLLIIGIIIQDRIVKSTNLWRTNIKFIMHELKSMKPTRLERKHLLWWLNGKDQFNQKMVNLKDKQEQLADLMLFNDSWKEKHQIYYAWLKIVIIIHLLCVNWNQRNHQDFERKHLLWWLIIVIITQDRIV